MLISQQEFPLQDDQRAKLPGDLQLFKLLLQPHFLFNSLNNLYALSLKKSDQTTDAIAGLSELLEKVVRCSRQEFIPLSQEITLLEDYIKLERIWLGETSFLLDFQVSGDTDSISVPPLVLYTFVENCFKHGIRKCQGNGWLTVKVTVKRDTLYFSTKNLVPELTEDNDLSVSRSSGFGVAAARELLERKCRGSYKLNCGRKGTIYHSDLILKKDSNQDITT